MWNKLISKQLLDVIKVMDKRVLIIRVTAILLMFRWTIWLWALYADDLGSVFSFGFWYLIFEKFCIAVLLNIGLWLSTTPFAMKRYHLTLGLMVPTICLSPFVMPRGVFVEGSIAVISIVGLAIFMVVRQRNSIK